MNTPLIRIQNLKKIYRLQGQENSIEVNALDGINLEIQEGEYIAIMGPSGSGKSTLMQILGMLDAPSDGEYFFRGKNIQEYTENELAILRSKEIGFIFQFFNLLPRTTCLDNVALPALYLGNENGVDRAKSLLTDLGMKDRLYHKPHQLSGGQQQRVAIARALVNQPRVLFADEPTGNINSQQAKEVMQSLSQLNEQGVTVILVTHEPDIADYAKRIVQVKDGKISSDTRKTELDYKKNCRPLEIETDNFSYTKKNRRFLDLLRENMHMALVALSLNKLRTALATLGIVIGITSVVAMIAIGEGAQKSIAEQLTSLGTNILNIRPISASKSNANSMLSRKFTLEEYQAIQSTINENSPLKAIDAKVYGELVVANGAANTIADLTGAFPITEQIENNTPVVGRFYSEEENKSKARVVLIGQTVAKKLFLESENPVGSVIKLNRMDFTVIGVLPAKGATAFKDRDNVIIVPIYTAMYRILGRKKLHSLTAEVRNPNLMDEAIEEISDTIRNFRKMPAEKENDFEIRNMNEIQEIYNRTTSIISSMLAAIATVSLLVGGIGIMNVMLVAVKERTKEIGLRKALGANRENIIIQFLTEAIFIGLLGGFIGVIGGYAVSLICASIFSWPVLVPIKAIFIAVLFSLFLGILFGLWPAREAAKLSPIEALRYE